MQIIRRFKDLLRLSRGGDVSGELRERLFGLVFAAISGLVLLGVVLIWRADQGTVVRWLQALCLAFLFTVWLLWRSKKTTAAAYLLLWGFWGLNSLVVMSEAGRNSLWLVPQFLLVVLTRFLLNGRVAALMGLFTVAFDFSIYSFSLNVLLPDSLQELTRGRELPPLVLSFLLVIFSFLLGDTVLRESLLHARRNEDRYRSLFDHTNDAVFLIDPGLRYLDVNKQGAALLGYEPEELVGKPIAQCSAPTEVASTKAILSR